ncbi:MAG: sugar ABC transporter substrate-binding protein [Chloroflexi bacterium]|nr:sugar ABC transporter substrate-binding protein [Chloroflexota bacterium]
MKRLSVLLFILVCFVAVSSMAAQDAVTLRLASWQWEDPAYLSFWEGTTDAFMEANPNVTIERFAFPIDQLWDKINLEVAAGTPPDIIEVTGFNVFEYLNLGVLAPLNQCFEGTDIVERVAGQDSYAVDADGNIYALNLSARTLELWINRPMFDAAGIDVPTNFEEFKAAAMALTNPANEEYGLVLTNTAHSRFYEGVLLMVVGYGGHWTKDGQPAFTEPEVINGVQFFKDLFDAGVMPQGVDGAPSQYAFFNSGKVGMTIDGPWYWAAMGSAAPEMQANSEIYTIPTDSGVSTGGPNNLVGIAAGSPHYDVACEYIKSIATTEWGQVWTTSSGTINPVEGAVSEDFLSANSWFQTFVDDASNWAPVAAPGLEIYHTSMVNMINNKLIEVMYNNKPVEQAMQELQEEVEEFLADQ